MNHDPGAGGGSGEEERLRALLAAAASGVEGGDGLGAAFAARRRARRARVVRGVAATSAVAVVAAVVVGAGAGSGRSQPAGPVAAAGPGAARRLDGALISFDACSDYLAFMRQQALAEVARGGSASPGVGGMLVPTGSSGFATAGGAAAGTGSASLQPVAAPAAGNSAGVPSSSTTTDQVPGVDEPDTVKTDGRVVVSLDGGVLRVLDPAAHVLGSLTLDGDTGGGLLLAGTRVVVLSAPDAAGPARAAVVDIATPAQPVLVRTVVLDGTIAAARLAGGQVRLVERSDGPRTPLPGPTPGVGTGTDAADRAAIAASTAADWLPSWQAEAPDGSRTARTPIAACDAVARPAHASGTTTVTVAELDPATATLGAGTGVVAAGSAVYATADHLYVAAASSPPQAIQPAIGTATMPAEATSTGSLQVGCCTVIPPEGSTTELYQFATPAGGPPTFTAAGEVPGWLLGPYAIDDDGTRVRVVSTERTASGGTDARLAVLAASGQQLEQVGAVDGLGAGEAVRAVRFAGDRAYVVTYRSFDPLYVVDLHDPAHPAVAGELDQPGFSEWLYPLPGDRLLGVGVDVEGGEPSGEVVATYDVHDPAHPARTASVPLATGLGAGLAGAGSFDPHTFVWWAPTDLALVAPPGGAWWGDGSGAGVAAFTVGPASLTRVATIGHGAEVPTRAVVVDGAVWVLTASGVVTAPLGDLAAATWHPW